MGPVRIILSLLGFVVVFAWWISDPTAKKRKRVAGFVALGSILFFFAGCTASIAASQSQLPKTMVAIPEPTPAPTPAVIPDLRSPTAIPTPRNQAEREYVKLLGENSELLFDHLTRMGFLIDAPKQSDVRWNLEMKTQAALIIAAREDALRIQPPPTFARSHETYLKALEKFARAANIVDGSVIINRDKQYVSMSLTNDILSLVNVSLREGAALVDVSMDEAKQAVNANTLDYLRKKR